MATTTPEAIRDRAIAVIEALVPAHDERTRFREHRGENGVRLQDWAEAKPADARRRLEVRTSGSTETPAVSNTDIEEHRVELRVLVAYPKNARDGKGQTTDRDDTADEDAFQIDRAIGMLGKANFAPPHPDATWIAGVPRERIEGAACDFVELVYTYIYKRARL